MEILNLTVFTIMFLIIVILISILIFVASNNDDEELKSLKEMYERDSKLSRKILEKGITLNDKILIHASYDKGFDGKIHQIRDKAEHEVDYELIHTVLLHLKDSEYTIIKKTT